MFRFHYERLKRRWTQQQLGDLAGINQTYVSLMERGRMTPTHAELEGLSRALGVRPPDVLLKPVLVEPPEVEESVAP